MKLKRDALTVDIPLGTTEPVRAKLYSLIETGKFDEASFTGAYAAGVVELKTGMEEFKTEMKRGRQNLDDRSFFYDFSKMPHFREELMMSDRYAAALSELGATPTAKRNLLCRRDAEFVKGRRRTQNGLMALSILSIGASFGTSALLAGAAEGTAAALTARSSHLALQMGVAMFDVATVGANILTTCNDTTSVIPKSPATCSSEDVFNGILKRAEASSCYANLGAGAAALAVPLAGTALVNGTKGLVTRVASKFTSNPQLEVWRLAEVGETAASNALRSSLETHLATAPVAEMDNLVWGMKPVLGFKVPAKVSKLGGFTGARIVTFDDGTKAIWKPTTGRRSYSIDGELGTYAVDEKLGAHLVPVTVKRTIDGKEGTLQLFVEGADDSVQKMTSPDHLRWFDTLIRNSDRHAGNYLSVEGRTVAIDHGVSLRPDTDRLFREKKNLEFDRSVKVLIAEKKSPLKFLPARSQLPKAKDPKVQEILEQYRDIRYDSARTLRVRAETLLPPKSAYEKLVSTSESSWREILEKSGTSNEAIAGFLARRRSMIESVEAAKKEFGTTILSDRARTPTPNRTQSAGPIATGQIEIKRGEMGITDADLFQPLTPKREKEILFWSVHEDQMRIENGRGASFYDQ